MKRKSPPSTKTTDPILPPRSSRKAGGSAPAGAIDARLDQSSDEMRRSGLCQANTQALSEGVAHPVVSPHPEVKADAQDPVVLIEIDPVMSAGFARDRVDVTVRGCALSPAAIHEVRMQVGDQTRSKASYGQPERAAVNTLPDGTQARQRPFQFNLPRLTNEQPEQVTFQIIARAEGGFECAESFTIDLDPAAETSVSVISGPTRSAADLGGIRPYAMMYIERASIDADGNLAVDGWAVARGPILALQIFADEQPVGTASLGGERDDVGRAYASYPNARLSGFALTTYVHEAALHARTLRAQLLCANGFALDEAIPVEHVKRQATPAPATGRLVAEPLPGAAPLDFLLVNQTPAYQIKADFRLDATPLLGLGLMVPLSAMADPVPALSVPLRHEPSTEIRMFCDTAQLKSDGTLFVDGWAVCAAGIAQVRVLLDERDVGLAVFGHERPDVGSLHDNIPMAALSGFRFESRLDERFHGEHIVRVIVRNARHDVADANLVVIATPVSQEPLSPTTDPRPIAGRSEPTPEQAAEFRFELDAPCIASGAVVEPITGRLTIDGWLLSRSGIASFEVFLDDQRLGDVHYGLARQDVGAAFPDWPNALRSGYAFHCPPRSLRDGEHTVRLIIRSNSGQEMRRTFQITVRKSDDQQDFAGIRRRVPRAEADLMSSLLTDLNYHPAYCFILRQGPSIDIGPLNATLDSLRLQAFPDWSVLVLTEHDDTATTTRIAIDHAMPHLADRFTILTPSDTERWNAPLAATRLDDGGDSRLYALLLPGDEIGADALLEFAVAGGMNRDADMLYADEVRPSPVTHEREPFFKPDFSPDLLLSTNYVGRPWVVTFSLLAKIGVTPASLLAEGEYDLVLRCAGLAARVHHIPKLLCQRTSIALDDPDQEQAALRRTLNAARVTADVLPSTISGTWRVKRAVPFKRKVSIIIPTCAAHGYIETCIKSLRARTAYSDYEIVVIDNIPDSLLAWKVWVQQSADKVVDIPDAFNWSIFNNRAAEVADGDYLLFLNDDIEIVQDDWLDAMMEHAQRPEVGITGPRLLYPDGKVQHAGMFLANNGIGRHAFRFCAADDPGYFGLALTQRNVIAVTGACLLVRRETFESLGRFDEAHEITNNDLDFCLRVHRAGLLTVFTPYTTLIHHELASRARLKDVFDLPHFEMSWKTLFAAGDPYFNPRLSRHADDYRPDDEPVQWVTPGAPLFRADEIKRILVVKLDHIGDFVTALPPIRRLRQIFPQATITVLAGPASRAFASIEPCIDTFIPFAFFHARSQLGEQRLEKQAFTALGEQLRPCHFDLAVDLRKHPSTRDVLKHTGARFLAGFDYLGQFPFLDIALDWDGDRTLQRKRSHVIDDLLALVNAIGHAAEADRLLMQPTPAPMPLSDLPEPVQALFGKPVVAIHPGAGNITKQWPTEHFSALIDLLIERNDVNVLLIGGPDEVEVADTLLQTVLHPASVGSMAGKTSLSDLPRLLLNCALYIGNDSGPKHIAAAVGIPTIGVHSGVVDPVEWGPLGPRAVALRRNMTCSPCYLANAEDCPRSLACLRLLEPNLVHEAATMLLKPSLPLIKATGAPTSSKAEPDANLIKPLEQGSLMTGDPVLIAEPAASPRQKGESRRPQPAPLPA